MVRSLQEFDFYKIFPDISKVPCGKMDLNVNMDMENGKVIFVPIDNLRYSASFCFIRIFFLSQTSFRILGNKE